MQVQRMNNGLVAVVALFSAICAPAAWAQAPATGIDPVVLRLNGANAIAQDVIPFIWDDQNLGTVNMGQVNLLDRNATACLDFGDEFGPFFDPLGRICLGVRVRSHLTGVAINLPMNANTLAASFLAATAPNGRFQTAVDMPGASLDTVMRVRVNLVAQLPNFIPANLVDDVVDFFTIQDDFAIGMDGLDLTVRATVARVGNLLTITNLEQFTPTVGAVSFTDSAGLVAIANFVSVSVNQFFGLPGTGTVNSIARTLVNNTIRDNADIRDMVQDSVNDALRAAGRVQGFSAALPSTDAIPLAITAGMTSFATRINDLRTNWNMSVTASGTTIALPFAYSYLARTAQDINTIPAAGDMQAFVPLSMFDKTGFELARKGLFNQTVTVPSMTIPALLVSPPVNITTPAFNVQISPSSTPRALAVAGQPTRVRLQFSARLANAALSPANAPRLNNVNATVDCILSLDVDERNGLSASLVGVNLTSLTGSVTFAGRTINVSAFTNTIRSALANAIDGDMPSVTLIPKVTNIMDPFAVELGTISVGSQYVNIPLSLVNLED